MSEDVPERAQRLSWTVFPDLVRADHMCTDAAFEEMATFRRGERRGFAAGMVYANESGESPARASREDPKTQWGARSRGTGRVAFAGSGENGRVLAERMVRATETRERFFPSENGVDSLVFRVVGEWTDV